MKYAIAAIVAASLFAIPATVEAGPLRAVGRVVGKAVKAPVKVFVRGGERRHERRACR